jgi:hypothetical protein
MSFFLQTKKEYINIKEESLLAHKVRQKEPLKFINNRRIQKIKVLVDAHTNKRI